MNPVRLVAAVAALAVGFGVTLVGVVLDADDAVAPVVSTSTVAPGDVDGADTASDDTDSATASTPESTVAPAAPAAEPTPTSPSAEPDAPDQATESPPTTDASRDADATPSKDDEASGGGGSVGRIPTTSAAVFPCSLRARDALRSVVEQRPSSTPIRSDVELLLIVVARRLEAAVPDQSSLDWFDEARTEFDAFTDVEGACSPTVEAGFQPGDDGLFCSAAAVSADGRLFEFFDEVLPPRLLDPCRDDFQGGL